MMFMNFELIFFLKDWLIFGYGFEFLLIGCLVGDLMFVFLIVFEIKFGIGMVRNLNCMSRNIFCLIDGDE